MKKIPLTQGKFTIVDDEDFDWLNQWKWYFGSGGYAGRNKLINKINNKWNKKTILMHRLIINVPKEMQTDHINLNKLDNRKSNLRIATRQQNSFNVRKQLNNTSGFKGVTWHKRQKKWQAQIGLDWKTYFLGSFNSKIDAAKKYNDIAKKYHKEFARLG